MLIFWVQKGFLKTSEVIFQQTLFGLPEVHVFCDSDEAGISPKAPPKGGLDIWLHKIIEI